MAVTSSATSSGLSDTTRAALAHLDSRFEKLIPFTHTFIVSLCVGWLSLLWGRLADAGSTGGSMKFVDDSDHVYGAVECGSDDGHEKLGKRVTSRTAVAVDGTRTTRNGEGFDDNPSLLMPKGLNKYTLTPLLPKLSAQAPGPMPFRPDTERFSQAGNSPTNSVPCENKQTRAFQCMMGGYTNEEPQQRTSLGSTLVGTTCPPGHMQKL